MKNFTALCIMAILVLSSCGNVSNAPAGTVDSTKMHVDSSAVITHSTIATDSIKHVDSTKLK